jgi:hypothetical protein
MNFEELITEVEKVGKAIENVANIETVLADAGNFITEVETTLSKGQAFLAELQTYINTAETLLNEFKTTPVTTPSSASVTYPTTVITSALPEV